MKLALIGMMGTGKTAVGMRLAERLGIGFADLDNMIVARIGMPIAQVFITFGEKVFRSYESSVLTEVVWHDSLVISCGGGVALNSSNMELLSEYVKIRLTANPETIYGRIKDDFSRPLIKDNSPPALARMIAERESCYAAYADITVQTDDRSIESIVDEILSRL